ncbi:MAG: FtsX-like permease family protein [Actinomycetota bacterium]
MRYLLSQLRFRKRRLLALAIAILVVSVSFSLLLSSVRTSRLKVVGTVEKSFRPAYDILARPRDSFTELERDRGLVRSNYLSGLFGGISFKQYRQIRSIPGVDVAAPIANIGYIMPFAFAPLRINNYISEDGTVDLYRLNLEWHSNGGLSRYPDADQYVYYSHSNPMRVSGRFGSAVEVDEQGREVFRCALRTPDIPVERPFSLRNENLTCFSARSSAGMPSNTDFGRFDERFVGGATTVNFPVLLAAIDPDAERELIDFDRTIVEGDLQSSDGVTLLRKARDAKYKVVPLLASTKTYLDEELMVEVQRLDVPAAPELRRRLSGDGGHRFVTRLHGTSVGTIRLPVGPIYRRLIDNMSVGDKRLQIAYDGYWTAGSVDYEQERDGSLTPQVVPSTRNAFVDFYYGGGWAPYQELDARYRKLTFHQASNAFTGDVFNLPALQVVGRFDPERLPGFSKLSAVPLETYYPPTVRPVDPSIRSRLPGGRLLPNQNIGGYVAQPPLMLTTLKGLKAMVDPVAFDAPNQSGPISVIRVRVKGVQGPDPLSRERIRRVAEEIHDRTGLAVDVTAGSSPQLLRVNLPEGKFGQPAMALREGWVQKGVAVQFLNTVDRKSLVLFVLVLAVCAFFLANGAFASVSSRRREIGVLACIGWSRAQIFRSVLGELALVGLLAGVGGALLAGILVLLLGLSLSLWHTLVVIPVAVVLTSMAGLLPARRAAGTDPLDALRPPIVTERQPRRVKSLAGLAFVNVRRVPSRTLLGAAGLLLGVGALTLIVAVNRAFQGRLAGTVMGNFITLEIRGVDLLSVILIMVLGAVSVADVLFLNLRERAAETVTLQTFGWSRGKLRLVAGTEGLLIGLLGSAVGATLALAVLAVLPGLETGEALGSAALAATAGAVVAVLASLAPLGAVARLPVSETLSEE